MAIKILAQNAFDGLSNRTTAEVLINTVARVQPDAAVFPEAYDVRHSDDLSWILARFTELGYEITYGEYGGKDPGSPHHGLMCLIRKERLVADRQARLVRIGERSMTECWLSDPDTHKTVRVLGVHLNDHSEVERQRELDDLLQHIAAISVPTVVTGDYNSVHVRDARGVFFWVVRLLSKMVDLRLLPVHETTDARRPPKGFGRIGSLAERLHSMASGLTVARLERSGFRDADTAHKPTHPARYPLAQLDHVMVTSTISVRNFVVLPRSFSDHRGIVAELML